MRCQGSLALAPRADPRHDWCFAFHGVRCRTVSSVRVMTLNIWHRSGPWHERLALIRRGLSEISPDLVGLQEVLRLGQAGPFDGTNDQASELAQDLGYGVAFGVVQGLGQGLVLGNALLARAPILRAETIELPSGDSPFKRALLVALVDSGAAATPVLVTHLSFEPHEGSLRRRQLEIVVREASRFVAPSYAPVIVMGDLNADPDSEEMRYLLSWHGTGAERFRLIDAWSACPNEPGYTFDRRNGFAAEAREPSRRIDYILAGTLSGRALRPTASRLVLTESVLGASGAPVWASDHFGLVTDLEHAVD